MFRRLVLTMLALSCLVATSTTWAADAAEPQAQANNWVYPLFIAAGAVAGVAATNAFTYGVGTIPYWIGITTNAPIVSPAAAAASRIFVITSGVLGAWIADIIYTSAPVSVRTSSRKLTL
jgi:hypothetical protein